MDKYLDTPAKRTRSASEKILAGKMAEDQHDKLPQVSEKPNVEETIPLNQSETDNAKGYVAVRVQQINNLPATSPVKGTKTSKEGANARPTDFKERVANNLTKGLNSDEMAQPQQLLEASLRGNTTSLETEDMAESNSNAAMMKILTEGIKLYNERSSGRIK